MRLILFFFLFSFALSAQNNIVKTVGYSYTNGTPTYTPAKAGSALALDTVAWRYYTWNGSTWISDGFRVQTISGCSAPGYTPTKFQSHLVINACTAGQGGPELYYWNGSAWLQINEGGTGGGIDTIASYTALRAYTGTSLAVYVQTFTYTFNSVSYTTLGGMFRRVATGTENGGTLIAASNGVKWARDWDGVNIHPEWWVVGGYDTDGTGSPTRLTLNGIYNDCDRLQAAVNIGTGKNIVLGSIVRTYQIDIGITVANDMNFYGNGVTLRRANAPFSALTSSFSGTSCTVADASGFRVGMSLLALDVLNSKGAATFYDGYGFDENSTTSANPAKPILTAISGNTLTYSAAPPATIPTGGIMMSMEDIFIFTNNTQHNLEINGIIFEGNWNNGGGAYRFSNDYKVSHTAYTNTASTKRTTFNYCEFNRVPGENIISCYTTIANCTADSLFGSLTHLTNSTVVQDNIATVTNNVVKNTGLAYPQNSHGEGAITFSANPIGYTVTNNVFLNGKHYVFGFADKMTDGALQNLNATFDGNIATGYLGVMIVYFAATTTLDKPFRKLKITNNQFTRCGDLMINLNAGSFKEGGHFLDFDISGNTFVDGRVVMLGADGLKFNNNKVLFSPEFGHSAFFGRQPAFPGFQTTLNTQYQSAVYATGRDVKITGNTIEAFPVYNDTLRYGLYTDVHALGALKDSSGIDTDFNYQSNFLISGNTVAGFARGISTMSGNQGAPAVVRESIGVKIENNYIHNSRTLSPSGDSWGLTVCPGCVASGNEIVRNNASTIGLYLIGPTYNLADTVSGLHSRVRGAIAKGNTVYGIISGSDIYVGNVNIWNCNNVLEGNMYESGIFNHGGNKNYVGGNVSIGTTNLPKLTNRKTPFYNYYLLYKNLY